MSTIYDNWEKLVDATLDREKLRELALAQSRETSFNSSISAGFGSHFSFNFTSVSYNKGYSTKAVQILISLTSQVIEVADAATFFQQECVELKHKAEKVKVLLQVVARMSEKLYDRPQRRIMDDTKEVLQKALSIVMRCRGSIRKCLQNLINLRLGLKF